MDDHNDNKHDNNSDIMITVTYNCGSLYYSTTMDYNIYEMTIVVMIIVTVWTLGDL